MSIDSPAALRPRRPRAAFAVVATATLSIIGALLVPVAAHAAVATVTGNVIGPAKTALAGVTVQAVRTADGVVAASTTSSATGGFTLPNIDPDEYTLKFSATATTYPQYLGGSSTLADAQPMTLADGKTSTVTAALAAAGTISGIVKTSASVVVVGAAVTIYSLVGDTWTSVRTTTTSLAGYKVAGLEPGDYRVKIAKAGYPSLFSGGAATLATASNLGVFGLKTTTANFVVGVGAKITGVVSADPGTPVPFAGATVQAWRFIGQNGAYTGVEKVGSPATSSATGAYTIGSLPPGDYTLYFDTPNNSAYGSMFLGGATDTENATVFTVASGATVAGKNITLVPAGSISGYYGFSGNPAQNVRVTLTGFGDDVDEGIVVQTTFTNALGEYSFTGLGPGSYNWVFGSFEDGDPNDGIVENTSYLRKAGSASITAGQNLSGLANSTALRFPLEALDLPTISAASWRVGVTIYSSSPTWNATSGYPLSGHYVWYRDGVEIAGQTAFSYTPVPGDLGHKISFGVYRTDWAIGSGYAVSEESPAIGVGDAGYVDGGDYPSTGAGIPKVGQVLTLDPGTWTVDNAAPEFNLSIVWTATWERSSDGSSWSTLETGFKHTVTAADLDNGPRLRVVMVGQRYGYADIEYVHTLLWVEEGTFANVTLPKVTATTTSLVASTGTWTPTPTSFTYEWIIHDQDGNQIASQFGSSITKSSVAGKYVFLQVTPAATHVNGSPVSVPAQSGTLIHSATSGALTGSSRVGEVLNAPAYVWTPTPTTTTYKWQYYNGTTWVTIAGATASSYQPTAAVRTKYLRVLTTATRTGYGSATKVSSNSAPVATGFAPANVDPAGFTGSVAVNSTVTAATGTWTPTPTSYSYQWKWRATDLGAATAISGATAATYKIPLSLENKYLEVLITVKRTGHTDATSRVDLGQVMSGTLVNTVKPVVTTVVVPLTSTTHTVTSNGTWSPAATSFVYNWILMLPDGSTSSGGGGDSYESYNTARFFPIDLQVTASRGGYADGTITVPAKNGLFWLGNSTDISAPDGTKVGEVLTSIDPTFNNPPSSKTLSYQWQVLSSGVWSSIAGATSASFTPSGAFLGKQVRLKVTANATRFDPMISYSGPVTIGVGDAAEPGAGPDSPYFSNTPAVAQKVTFYPGNWSVPGLTFTYQWQSSDSEGGTYVNIPLATASSYTPKTTDFGRWLHLVVTAKKTGYTTAVVTSPSADVGQGTITPVTPPVVSKSGYTLAVTPGTWSQTGLTVSYEWRRVADDGTETIVGTGPTYTLDAADDGLLITVTVSVSKAPIWATSAALGVGQLGKLIRPTAAITVDGARTIGSTLTTMVSGWTPTTVTQSYQWLRNGVAIPGATASTYTLVNADLARSIAVKVTATRFGYPTFTQTIVAGSAASATLPVNTVAPTITVPGGTTKVGLTATASTGTWSVASMTYSYQWYRSGVAVIGATASTYAITADDYSLELQVKVTASKAGYSSVSALSGARTVLIGDGAIPSAALNVSLLTGALRPNAITWNLPVTLTYQWRLSTDSGGSYNDIVGATANSYVPAGLSSGDYVTLVITATRPGHTTVTLTDSSPYVVP